MLPKFIKIFPHKYKRVLGIARKKEAELPLASTIAAPSGQGMALPHQKQVLHG